MVNTAGSPTCSSCGNKLAFVATVGPRQLYSGVVCRSCGKVECSVCKGSPAEAPCKRCGREVSPAYDTYLGAATGMLSFVIVVAGGYTSDALSAWELFTAIEQSKVAPPFEVEVIVASGPGIAGEVLMLYVEDGFAGVPARSGWESLVSDALRAWLLPICDLDGPRYIVEPYGPRSHPLEGYWPQINVAKRKRLTPAAPTAAPSGSPKQASPAVDAEPPQSPASAAAATPQRPPAPKKSWWRRLLEGEGAPGPTSPALTFAVRSLEVKQSYEYGGTSSRRAVTATDAQRILVADVAVHNTTMRPRRFSSQQIGVCDAKGAAVAASFYGVGDSIAEAGASFTTESTTKADGKLLFSYKGRLSTDASFLEWELQPLQTYQGKLVFVIPAGAQDVTVKFSGRS